MKIGKKFKNILKRIRGDQRGGSLIELLIAFVLFSIVILAATGIMQSSIEGQKSALASQNTQESMRFAFEMMSKEIRNARSEHTGPGCADHLSPYYKVYNTENAQTGSNQDTGSELYFKNKNDECVGYYLSGGRLFIERQALSLPVTPSAVEITELNFFIDDDLAGAFHSIQPRVTFSMEAEMGTQQDLHKQKIILQTTVSSRYYE